MRMIPLGNSGQKVSSIGLGCMGMSDLYGPSDRAESIATIHAAIDAGITLLDTGDFYGMGHNEMLIGEALKGRLRDQVQLSVKFGALRDASGTWLGYDARPKAVRNFLAYTLQRLGVDYHRRHRGLGEGRLRAPYRSLRSRPAKDKARCRRSPHLGPAD
ncbi:aldo/keto reductase family protein [Sinorhizobium medicae]|nr:aldo/keto reductase family protein [Sinorhizobium medicae]